MTAMTTVLKPKPRRAHAADPEIGEIWRENHQYLLNVAYRMLGSVTEAEDIVQDAFAKLLDVDLGEIQDARGWLVVVVTRRCLDQLRSARSRHEVYVGPWLPEPVIPPPNGAVDPVDRVTLDDSVRMALLIVLERLSPAERAAFVLHDVFQYSFEEVGSALDRTPAACRQLASRARRRVSAQASPARFQVDQSDLTRVADQFFTAATNGDLDALLNVLDPNVVGHADSGGVVAAPRRPISGRQLVAETLLAFNRARPSTLVPMPVNSEPGALVYENGHLTSVIALEIRNGLVTHIHVIANPAKIAYVASLVHASPAPQSGPAPGEKQPRR